MAWVCRGERNISAAHLALVAPLLNKKPKFVIDEAADDVATTVDVGLSSKGLVWVGSARLKL